MRVVLYSELERRTNNLLFSNSLPRHAPLGLAKSSSESREHDKSSRYYFEMMTVGVQNGRDISPAGLI